MLMHARCMAAHIRLASYEEQLLQAADRCYGSFFSRYMDGISPGYRVLGLALELTTGACQLRWDASCMPAALGCYLPAIQLPSCFPFHLHFPSPQAPAHFAPAWPTTTSGSRLVGTPRQSRLQPTASAHVQPAWLA